MQTAIVKYQIATYSGEVKVSCNENDENEAIIAKAKQQLRKTGGPFPFGYESFKVIARHDDDQ